MEELNKEYMEKIKNKLNDLGIPAKPENQVFCMIFDELRKLNHNIEEILSKFKEEK